MLVDLQDGVWQKTGIPLDISLVVAAKLKIPNIDIEGFNKIMDLRKVFSLFVFYSWKAFSLSFLRRKHSFNSINFISL